MLRSNYRVDKHAGDIIEKTSFNGNHAGDIKMNTIVVILAVVVLGAAVDVQKPKTIGSGNEDNGGEDDTATVKALDQNESALLYIRSLIAQINRISQTKKADGDEKNNDTKEEESLSAHFGREADRSDTEKDVINESEEAIGRNGEDNRRINILQSIKNILKGEPLYRRLDIEDNGDISADVDIDDPMVNEFNDKFSGFNVNRGYTGYGARLEMKGRSGGYLEDPPIYYPNMPRRLFYNPGYSGYYPRATPAPVAIPINRDSIIQLQPLNLYKSLPNRRTESQVIEETNIDILDDANSYKFTPDDSMVEAPKNPWSHGKHGNIPIV